MVAIQEPGTGENSSLNSSRDFFRHREFVEHPERACHSLSCRLDPLIEPAFVVATMEHSRGRKDFLTRDFKLWTETLQGLSDAPASVTRRNRELTRPVNLERSSGRVVVLTYADGVSDLIVVAHRARTGLTELQQICHLLSGGTLVEATAFWESEASPKEAVVQQQIEWGLGDHRKTGHGICSPIPAVHVERTHALDVAITAVCILLSRYGEENPHIALLHARSGESHELRGVATAGLSGESIVCETLSAHSRITILTRPADSVALPTVGILITESDGIEDYVACFAPVFPLTFVWEYGCDGQLTGSLWYDEGQISPSIANQVVRHVGTLLQRVSGGKIEEKVAEITLVDDAEIKQILAAGRSVAPSLYATTINDLFQKMATSQPDSPALSDDAETVSYRELNQRADELASGLQIYGVRRGDRVGVCLDRKVDLVVTLLAILKTGAAYVPMDAAYPEERLLFTILDAGLALVVSDAQAFPKRDGFEVFSPEEVRQLSVDGNPVKSEGQADDIAYVIYTSGSTGRPKGVAIPHKNVVSLLAATREEMSLSSSDTWTLFHSSAFDFSVWEMWGCLLSGGHLFVVSYWVSRSPEEFYDLLVEQRVTVLNQTPSAFSALQAIDEQRRDRLALRLVVFGGEALHPSTLSAWFRRHPYSECQLVNMFGITETTVHVTRQGLTAVHVETNSKSVGKALPGWSVSIRDNGGRVQPFGVPGEIYVGGAALASHYLNRDDITKSRFIFDTLSGERVYRSGDLGRLHPDGTLDHLGRVDSQVKVRGFRIELDEIRSVLLDSPGVHTAAVLLSNAEGSDAANVQIDAYIAFQDSTTIDFIRRHIARYLPDYMMPSSFTTISQLPVTVNGKLDTVELKRQKDIQLSKPVGMVRVECDGTSNEVLRVWREVLDRHVLMDDDFFESGGNSLLAVRLSVAIRKLGFGSFSFRELFTHSTPSALCTFLSSNQAT